MFPPRGRLAHTICSASVIALACGGDPTDLLPEAFFARPAQRAAAKDPSRAAVTNVCLRSCMGPSRVFRANTHHTYYMTCLRVRTAKEKDREFVRRDLETSISIREYGPISPRSLRRATVIQPNLGMAPADSREDGYPSYTTTTQQARRHGT